MQSFRITPLAIQSFSYDKAPPVGPHWRFAGEHGALALVLVGSARGEGDINGALTIKYFECGEKGSIQCGPKQVPLNLRPCIQDVSANARRSATASRPGGRGGTWGNESSVGVQEECAWGGLGREEAEEVSRAQILEAFGGHVGESGLHPIGS